MAKRDKFKFEHMVLKFTVCHGDEEVNISLPWWEAVQIGAGGIVTMFMEVAHFFWTVTYWIFNVKEKEEAPDGDNAA